MWRALDGDGDGETVSVQANDDADCTGKNVAVLTTDDANERDDGWRHGAHSFFHSGVAYSTTSGQSCTMPRLRL